jgi:hypothetical protein
MWKRIMPDLPSGTVTFLFTDIEGSTALWKRDRQAMVIAADGPGRAAAGAPRVAVVPAFIAAIKTKASQSTPGGSVYACRVIAGARSDFAELGVTDRRHQSVPRPDA